MVNRPILYSFRRCPYAIRARLAIYSAGIQVELREILLREKAPKFLEKTHFEFRKHESSFSCEFDINPPLCFRYLYEMCLGSAGHPGTVPVAGNGIGNLS